MENTMVYAKVKVQNSTYRLTRPTKQETEEVFLTRLFPKWVSIHGHSSMLFMGFRGLKQFFLDTVQYVENEEASGVSGVSVATQGEIDLDELDGVEVS